MHSSSFNEHYRFGSAAWADEYQLRAAGLFDPKGPQIGFLDRRPLHLEGDAPMITIGGAGSGKLRDVLGYVVCRSPGERMMFLDRAGNLPPSHGTSMRCTASRHISSIRMGCTSCRSSPAIRSIFWI
ncbi:MAG: hypothetical protein LRY76_06745 [Alphaproteobacteria bacterium]|nr:hypothetical protein [Alphaproteobacteria bacterium]